MFEDNFQVTIDRVNKCINFTLKGREPSEYYADRYLNAYGSLERAWEYDRIADERQCERIMSHIDVERLSQQWINMTRGQTVKCRAVMLTWDTVTHSRVPVVTNLFPGLEIQTFTDRNEALAWLSSPR